MTTTFTDTTVDLDETWIDHILTTALDPFNGSSIHWLFEKKSPWQAERFHDTYTSASGSSLGVTIEWMDDRENTTIAKADLDRAYAQVALGTSADERLAEQLLLALSTQDLELLDAKAADILFQVACAGHVVFP